MRFAFAACMAGALAAGCAADGRPTAVRSAPSPSPSPSSSPALAAPSIFRFRVGLWANLHQVLIHESLLPKPGFEGPKSLAHHSVAEIGAIPPADLGAWRDALAYYDRRFTTRNTFTDEFMDAVRVFNACDNEPSLEACPGLAADWKTLLGAAAPVYRAHFWPAHERSDRAYVEAIQPLVAKHGAWLMKRLAAVYETPWPTEPIDVDVTSAVPPFGASTIGEPPFTGSHAPLIIVSSQDPGYTGDSGLEMIFHESSHLLVDRVQSKLDASAKRQGRTMPRQLWHFVLFYTAGHVTQERLGPAYVPYAEIPAHRIFDGDAAPILAVLVRAWQPYLDGRTTLDAAVDAVVAGF